MQSCKGPSISLIENAIRNAVELVYRTEFELIERHLHEQTICARVMFHLQHFLPEWHVDVEFNRGSESNCDPKRDLELQVRRPDIAVHRRGPKGPNLAIVTAKCFWSNNSCTKHEADDLSSLSLASKFGYQSVFRLTFCDSNYELLCLFPNQ